MFYFTEMEKKHFENRLKIICFVKSWPPGVIKLEKNTSKFLGPIVQRDQLSWGPFVHGDQMSRYCLFLWTNCLGDHFPWGPNEPGLFAHGDQLWGTKCPGTECVRDQMRCSRINDRIFFLAILLIGEWNKALKILHLWKSVGSRKIEQVHQNFQFELQFVIFLFLSWQLSKIFKILSRKS